MKGRDVLFKGCTRPPMIYGVPMTPFAGAIAFFVLISTWGGTFLLMVGMLPTFIMMRLIAKKDDQQFRLLFLKIYFTLPALKNRSFWRAYAAAPVSFKRNKRLKLSRKEKQE